jgi:predicted RNA binding protein YcfA (HicA-like mRNA interferase family)
MPKLPRISSREAIRALERLGFEQIRQTGSHVVMKKATDKVKLVVFSASRIEAWHATPTQTA